MTDTHGDYQHGEMNIETQKTLFSGFLTATAWSSLILILAIGYATFTLTMGVNWAVSLAVFAVVGIVAGLLMNLGGAWVATVIGLAVVAVFIQLLVTLGGLMMK